MPRIFSPVRCALFVLLLFALVAPLNLASAQNQGQTIRNKMSDLLGKTGTLGDRLETLCDLDCQGTPAGRRFKDKVDRLKQNNTRLNNAHGRTSDDDYQEVLRRHGKKKSQGCDSQVQVCDDTQTSGFAAAAAPDPEFDDAAGQDLGGDLDEVSAEVDALNNLLAGNVPPPVPTPDVNLENANYFFPAAMRPSSGVMLGAFIANLAAEKASAIADHFCEQTAVALGFGGNASAACAVIEGVYQVLNAVYQFMDYVSQDSTSAEVSGTYARAKNIFDQLVITDSKADGTNDVVMALGQKVLQLEANQRIMMDNLATILRLLSTPQGQRPSFPVK